MIQRKLKIEIATTVDAMEPFVKATYKPKGDSALNLVAYQQLSMLYASVSNQHSQMLLLLLRQKQREMLQMSSNSSTILRLVCSLRTTTSI